MEKIEVSTVLKSHFLRLYQIALSDGEFSLLELKYEANGTIEECKRLGVLALAYSGF